MATVSFRQGDLTFEEFLDIVPDGQKADLLDGVIYMASRDNVPSNDLNAWLSRVLGGYVEVKQLGKVYVARVAYRIGDKGGPEPDLSFLPTNRLATRRRGYIKGPPALAIEIVSPDSVQRDYVHKRRIYEEAGVGEYWIIDPDERRATFLVLQGGRFRERKPVRHIWRSKVIDGFWIDVRWLWDEERPSAYSVLQRLLGEM
jgi:Uma2 family endonuclease